VLLRDAEIAQKSYETAMQRAVDSRVESHASLTNVNMLYAAVAPFKPARPRIGINIALSVVVGTLLGLSVVLLMETFDRRVRSLVDLENDLHVPLLVELNAWHPTPGRLLGQPLTTGHALPGPS
jgi:capsular polysaccharide biosynthesis protein